ncbi:MAG: hypothetical protein HN390_01970 [Anaerolineae bacterium]|jgi:hypothetical protein|nr:hypothetical protein [Anaerolineae bacterium]MBT7189066.1 hypothetical protein [Anaerolineae bacterium]MBT7990339.1 hypothetical protein [Anaerolineae bacterium]
MKTVQQSSAWFSKQNLLVKTAIGCSGLFMICCLCSVPVAILIPSTPTPETSTTPVAQIETSPPITQTETPIEIPLSATNTPEPTYAPPPSTATATEIISLLDVFNILGKPVNEVEAIVGSTILVTPNDDNDDNLSGGEYRDYIIGEYSVFVVYDKNGIARVFQVLDGLSDENYSIDEWNLILPKFGVFLSSAPEREAPAAVYWDNYDGYFIAVVASGASGSPVWTVQIAEAEYAP